MESLESQQVPDPESIPAVTEVEAVVEDPPPAIAVLTLDKPLDGDKVPEESQDEGQVQSDLDKGVEPGDQGQNGEKTTENGDHDGEEDGENGDEDVTSSECLDDPHFATICSFLDKFGPLLRLDPLPYDDLQAMLETTVTIPEPLMKLHIVLLRRVFKSIAVDKWERSLAKFCHFYSIQDGWEIERFGYKNSKLQTKLRLLKHLLEAQFDFNVKFKAEVNKLESGDLRLVPLGQDCEGQLYWYQVDEEANLRVYREDVDEESWEVVACTRKGLCELITKLELGDVKKRLEEPLNLDEDSNEKEIEVKEILRDTGKFNPEEDEDEEDDDEEEEENSDGSETDSKKPEPASVNLIVKKEVETEPSVIKSEIVEEIAKPVSVSGVEDMDVDAECKTAKTDVVVNANVKEAETEKVKNSDAIKIKVEEVPLQLAPEELSMESEVLPIVPESSNILSGEAVVDNMENRSETKVQEMEPDIPPPDIKTEDKPETAPVLLEKNETLSATPSESLDRPPALEEVDAKAPSGPPPQSIKVEAKDKVPVEEPPFVKQETWVCGEENESNTDAVSSEKIIQITTPTTTLPSEIVTPLEKAALIPPSPSDGDSSKKKEPEIVVHPKSTSPIPVIEVTAESADKINQPPSAVVVEDLSKPIEDKRNLPLSSSLEKSSQILVETEALPCETTDKSQSAGHVESNPPKTGKDNQEINKEAVKLEEKESVEESANSNPIQPSVDIDLPVANDESQSPQKEVKQIPQPQPLKELTPPAPEKIESPKTESAQEDTVTKTAVPVVTDTLVAPAPKPKSAAPNPFGSLVSYGSSDDDDEELAEEPAEKTVETITSNKRKAEDDEKDLLQPSKLPKVEESKNGVTTTTANPIVGEAVEESLMMVVGQGSGAECEGGNAPQEEELLENNQKENVAEQPSSENTSSGLANNTPTPVKRGRGRPGKKSGGGVAASAPSPKKTTPRAPRRNKSGSSDGGGAPRGRKKRELEGLGVPLDALEINGSSGGDGGHSERPVRASRRIAQIRLKEEEERRKMEEEQLAQLKAAQLLRKQQKKAAAAAGISGETTTPIKKEKKGNKIGVTDYVPGSPSSASSEELNSEDGDDFAIHPGGKKKGKKGRRGRRKKIPGKPGRPWATDSDESEDGEGVEEEEEYHYEEEDHDHDHLRFNESDHEFSPESDLGEDDDEVRPSRHARTAKRGQVEAEQEMGCKKCGKGDHPEWILLCDKCDAGWHASCLKPQLWVIPEGDWFCPPCQHSKLVTKLNENLLEYDKLLKRQENDVLKRQRLTYVGISLENVLPESEDQTAVSGDREDGEHRKSPSRKGSKHDRGRGHRSEKRSSRRRRIILSDEEISDNFIATSENSSDEEKSGENNSLDEDSDGPIYRLRARRSAKTFDYKEYDDLINSACRASDDEFAGEEALPPENNGGGKHMPGDEFEPENEDDEEDEEEDDEPSGGGGGKNAAYEQHLKEAEEEKAQADKKRAAKEKAAAGIIDDDVPDAATTTTDATAASTKSEPVAAEAVADEEDTDEEGLTEKEKKRRRNLKKMSQTNKKKKRSFRNLDDYSEDDNSDEDFHGSEVDEDEEGEEDAVEEDESDWSGDKDDSDDSLAAVAKQRGGKKGKYGRKDEYLEVGAVRRSTRAVRRKARVSYDESDDDDDEGEEGEDKWNSEENSEEEEDSGSESDDETYGKVKRKKPTPKRSSTPRFLLGAVAASSNKKKKGGGSGKRGGGGGGGNKKRKKRGDEEEVDRAWNSSQGSKAKKSAAEEKVERRTRGMKINFKDILDSDLESDDDGNVLPKRRRLSSGEDEDEAEASRRLAERIKAANQREAAMYAKRQKEAQAASEESDPGENSSSGVTVPADPPTAVDPIPLPVAQMSGIETAATAVEPEKKETPIEQQIHRSEVTAPGPPPPVVVPLSSSSMELEMALAKPVPAPPIPPALAKALGRGSKKKSKGGDDGVEKVSKGKSKKGKGAESPHFLPPSSSPGLGPTSLSAVPPLVSSPHSSKKSSSHSVTTSAPSIITSSSTNLPNPIQQGHNVPISSQSQMMGMPPGMPMNPSMFSSNSSPMRPFHPMWARPPGGPPPYGMGSPPPNSIGKPPPLNNSPFMPQHPSSVSRPGYPPSGPGNGPPLRIPNPASNPALQQAVQAAQAQAFQHFRRDGGGGMYRPTQPGGLPPGLLAGFQGSPERFFGAPSPYGPYGMMPPQGPQGFFGPSPFDPFRPAGSETFKDEPRSAPPNLNTPRSGGRGPSPQMKDHHHEPPPGPHNLGGIGHPVPIPPAQSESEFGGLVSYFSSQRSEEDMES